MVYLKMKCLSCLHNFSNIILVCHHRFCNVCALSSLKLQTKNLCLLTTNEKNQLKPHCPFCSHLLTESEIVDILGEDYPKQKQTQAIRQQEQDQQAEKLKLCFRCGTKKEKELFYQYDECQHMCKECLFECLADGKVNCFKCQKYLKCIERAYSEKSNCDGCSKPGLISYKDLTVICDGHKFCKECIEKIYLDDFKCKKCLRPLNGNSIEKVLKICQRHCLVCAGSFHIDFIVKKSCECPDICFTCHGNNENYKACNWCRARLPDSTRNKLKSHKKNKQLLKIAAEGLNKANKL